MVQERQKQMFDHAEPAHVADPAPHDRKSRAAALRRHVGAAMVRAGVRLQGTQRRETAADFR